MGAVILTTVRSVLITASVLFLYYMIPFDGAPDSVGQVVRLTVGTVFFLAVFIWQVRAIWHAKRPGARALQALLVIFLLFLIMTAGTYLGMDHQRPSAFSEHLDHTAALYFSMTVLSTVGFGDITPVSQTARVLVTGQMVIDVLLVAFTARGLIEIVRSARQRSDPDDKLPLSPPG